VAESVSEKTKDSEKAKRLNMNPRQRQILLFLVDEGSASVDQIKEKLHLVRRTAQRNLTKLAELGLVREVAKSKTDPTKYYGLL